MSFLEFLSNITILHHSSLLLELTLNSAILHDYHQWDFLAYKHTRNANELIIGLKLKLLNSAGMFRYQFDDFFSVGDWFCTDLDLSALYGTEYWRDYVYPLKMKDFADYLASRKNDH